MKTKLIAASPDFISTYVEDITKRAKGCMGEVGDIVAMLTFLRGRREFNVPIEYEHFLRLGKDMGKAAVAASCIHAMGPEFAMLAMQLAARSENQKHQEEDRGHFIHDVGHMLYHMAPDAFFVSMPSLVVAGNADPALMAEIEAAGADHPNAKMAIVVIGRNPIRSYGIITPFLTDPQGNFYFDKPYTVDSLRGEPSRGLGPFSDIYEPTMN